MKKTIRRKKILESKRGTPDRSSPKKESMEGGTLGVPYNNRALGS